MKRSPAKPRLERVSATSPAEPDLRRAERVLVELLSIAGPSCEEKAVADYIVAELIAAGVARAAIKMDRAHRRSARGGQVGNLVCKLPGRGPTGVRSAGRRMFSAHMDTVPLAVGVKPVVRGDLVMPAQKDKALGGDNRSGVAVVLATAIEVVERELAHPPLTFLWSVQEEIGLQGMKNADIGLLGGPVMGVNFDGGEYEELTIGATGAYRTTIEIHGRASHAGTHPQNGISAITILSLAVAQLHRDGWLGLVRKGKRWGTSNVGVVQAGDATNVVTPHALVRAEARSHDPAFRKQIVKAIEDAFRRAARSVRNEGGECGRVEIDTRLDYESFRLDENSPAVAACAAAVRGIGGSPTTRISSGGLDANFLSTQCAPTVTLGAGQIGAHTAGEQLDLRKFRQACRVALRLATASERD